MTDLQIREVPHAVTHDVDERRRQVLVRFPHETIDSYLTDFSRDAFRDSFARRLPIMLWQHIRSEPIGRSVSAQVMPTVNEVRAEFSDFEAVPRAKQAFSQIRDGHLRDFSFGFPTRSVVSIPHPSVRGAIRYTRVQMDEISPVTVGSIPGAQAVAVRAEAHENSLVHLGDLADEGLYGERYYDELMLRYDDDLDRFARGSYPLGSDDAAVVARIDAALDRADRHSLDIELGQALRTIDRALSR